MIVVDTTVLVYALGVDHPLREPCRQLVDGVRTGQVEATTTAEVIQELVHVRARHMPRGEAVRQGRAFVSLLSPLMRPTAADLADGLSLFEAHSRLAAFDAVLAAAAIGRGSEALISADLAFGDVAGLRHLVPGSREFDELLTA